MIGFVREMFRRVSQRKMLKVLSLLTVFSAVIHIVMSSDAPNASPPRDLISFMERFDSSDAIRDKIRTEMDDYKRIKEMMFKNKLTKSSTKGPSTTAEPSPSVVVTETQATSTEAPVTSTATSSSPQVTSTEPVVAAKQLIEMSTQSSSTKAPDVISSTVRQIFLQVDSDDDATESNFDDTTIMPDDANSSHVMVDDRFILNAPNLCKDGRKPDASGRCRIVI
jgi:hypothetical protein